MKFDAKVWLEEAGIVQFDRVSPGQCGDKYLIYSRHYPRPLVSLFFDPVTDFQEGAGGVGWKVVSGESKSNSLFIRLRELSSRFLCHWFFVYVPQNEYTVLLPVQECKERFWNEVRFNIFENYESGGKYLGLVLGEGKGIIVFSLVDGFEIAFYGPVELWDLIKDILHKELI